MPMKIIPTLSPNNLIIITRKTTEENSKSTVHVFVPDGARSVTDILINASKNAHKTSIQQSNDINDGQFHTEIHDAADHALKAIGATQKYGSESHCHITNMNDVGPGFIVSVL